MREQLLTRSFMRDLLLLRLSMIDSCLLKPPTPIMQKQKKASDKKRWWPSSSQGFSLTSLVSPCLLLDPLTLEMKLKQWHISLHYNSFFFHHHQHEATKRRINVVLLLLAVDKNKKEYYNECASCGQTSLIFFFSLSLLSIVRWVGITS